MKELGEGEQTTKMRDQILNLVKRISGQQNILVLPRLFIDLTADINSALLLSQLLYWSDRTQDPDGWVYKSHTDWHNEIGITRYSLGEAKAKLTKLGLIETKLKKANGAPTTHFRVNEENFSKSLNSLLSTSKGDSLQSIARNQTIHCSNSDNPLTDFKQSLTETTTETTTRDDGGSYSNQNELFEILERIPNFPRARPAQKLCELQADYPNLDYRLEFKKFVEYWSTRKLKRPWLALRNWLEKAKRSEVLNAARDLQRRNENKKRSRELPRQYTPPPTYDD